MLFKIIAAQWRYPSRFWYLWPFLFLPRRTTLLSDCSLAWFLSPGSQTSTACHGPPMRSKRDSLKERQQAYTNTYNTLSTERAHLETKKETVLTLWLWNNKQVSQYRGCVFTSNIETQSLLYSETLSISFWLEQWRPFFHHLSSYSKGKSVSGEPKQRISQREKWEKNNRKV